MRFQGITYNDAVKYDQIIAGEFVIRIQGVRGTVGEFESILGESNFGTLGWYFRNNNNTDFNVVVASTNTKFPLNTDVNIGDSYDIVVARDTSNLITVSNNGVLSATSVTVSGDFIITHLGNSPLGITNSELSIVNNVTITNQGTTETFNLECGQGTTVTGSKGTIGTIETTNPLGLTYINDTMWDAPCASGATETYRMCMAMGMAIPFGAGK